MLLVLVLALAGTVLASAAGADPLDDAIRAVTCSDLFAGVSGALGDDVNDVLGTSYCHSQSDTTVCAPPGTVCTVSAQESGPEGSIQVDVTGVADPGGPMLLTVGKANQERACGLPLYVGLSVRFESEGVSGLVANHRVAKPLDQAKAQNGAGNIGICYTSPKPFTDTHGNLTVHGLLPLCESNGAVAPCILHRQKNRADAIVRLKLPSGDPTWKTVEEKVDELLG